MKKVKMTGAGLVALATLAIATSKVNAQYPQPCHPDRITVMQDRTITVPYQGWHEETRMVPQVQMVPQTVRVPHIEYQQQTIREPVVYQRVDPCRPRCDIGKGIEQFIGGLAQPFEMIGGIFDCKPRPERPHHYGGNCGPKVNLGSKGHCDPCQPKMLYVAPVVPVMPSVPYRAPPCGCR